MVKRKRPEHGGPAVVDKAELFTAKLAESLHNQALAPHKEKEIAAALAEALHQLPASSAIQRRLQADLSHYTQILVGNLKELQTLPSERRSFKKQNTAGAQCLEKICHRTCTTDQQKAVRCHHFLAACVGLHHSDHVKHRCGTGLAVAVDAIRGALSELCADGKDAATQALLLQPVVSKLCTAAMLQYERSSRTSDSGLSTQEVCQIGAEAAVLAAEVRIMLEESYQADKQVALALYDFQVMTGGDPCAVLELLLDSCRDVAVPSNKDTSKLWQTLYRAAVQLPTSNAGERVYLLHIAAAQQALDSSFESQKSQLLAPFDSMAAPASFIAWLKQQPSSGIVQQCLDALQQSPIKLTQHLLSSQKQVRSLLALHSTLSGTKDSRGGADSVADNPLFYVDDAGETAFGRGWHAEGNGSGENADRVEAQDSPGVQQLNQLHQLEPHSSASSDQH